MEPIEIKAIELTRILKTLGAPVVITKNVRPESERNYRSRRNRSGEMLDGFWPYEPKRVTPGNGFAMHYVERDNQLWLGDYLGVHEDRNSAQKVSLIVGDVQCFHISDLNLDDEHQQELRAILKQPGAVIYSYYDPVGEGALGDTASARPTFRMAEVKQRLQQRAFRASVFAYHGARCVVTGCTVEDLLEAAHLVGRTWIDGDNRYDDGIPLRADIHRAYDRGLIRLDDEYRISHLDDRLMEEYGQYLRR